MQSRIGLTITRWLLVLGVTLVATACPPVTLTTQQLTPIFLGTSVEILPYPNDSKAAHCQVVPNVTLMPLNPPGQTQITVGYTDPPDSCPNQLTEFQNDSDYGVVQFDLKRFVGKGLVSAILKFQRTDEPPSVPGGSSSVMFLEFWLSNLAQSRFLNQPQEIVQFPTGTKVFVNTGPLKIANSTDFTVDISEAMRSRLLSGLDTTLYLVGDPTLRMHPNPQTTVLSTYQHFVLEITYNPNQ